MSTNYLRAALGVALLGALHFSTLGTATAAATWQEPATRPPGPPPGRGPGRTPEQQADDLAKNLKLDDKQKKEVAAIFKSQHEQMQAQRGSNPPAEGDRAKGMEQMRRLQSDTDAKLKGVLAAAQYKQYEAQKPRHGSPKGDKDGQRGKGSKSPKGPSSAS